MALCTSLNSSSVQFIPCSDTRLNQESKQVTDQELRSQEIQKLILDMLELSGYEANPTQTHKKARLVGLAAPQIGVMKQIIIIDASASHHKNTPTFDILINPEIIWESQETESIPQGCYSVPDTFTGLVNRANAVVVKALDPQGNALHKRYEGYPAHVVQHEVDHLHGIRFPQRLKTENDLHIFPNGESDLRKYRKDWKNWPHHASSETWNKMKNGQYENLEN